MHRIDFNKILDDFSFIVSGAGKSGKMTFVLYMVMSLFQKNALIFSAQEPYLFRRRINVLISEYSRYSDIRNKIDIYFLKEEYKTLKQRYGFDFLIQEYEKLISASEAGVVIIHRFEEFFEFQNRYEIGNVYKSLIKICIQHSKKLIFIVNNEHENFEQIYNLAEEFSEVSITIDVGEENKRIIQIRDFLRNKEYPPLSFVFQKDCFLLDYNTNKTNNEEKVKNVLLCELNFVQDNIIEICQLIFNKPGFRTKTANSLATILQEIFISPDIIIVMMKRTEENFKTVKSIKKYLPHSPIIAIDDQDFVRSEDLQQAYACGIDELFCNGSTLDKFILACQKASNSLFYTEVMESLPKYPNVMKSMDDLKAYAQECIEKSIYFCLFVFQKDKNTNTIQKPSRKYDFIYESEKKIYYLALNTEPKDVQIIKEKFAIPQLTCVWESIDYTKMEECLK